MKKILLAVIIVFTLTKCDSVEPDNVRFSKLPTRIIKKLDVQKFEIFATIIVETPTPCWRYAKTEKTQDIDNATLTIYGKGDGEEICPQVLDSFELIEKISFTTKGKKTIKFWTTDSTFIDTTVIIN